MSVDELGLDVGGIGLRICRRRDQQRLGHGRPGEGIGRANVRVSSVLIFNTHGAFCGEKSIIKTNNHEELLRGTTPEHKKRNEKLTFFPHGHL